MTNRRDTSDAPGFWSGRHREDHASGSASARQYVRAFEEANLDALVALFHEDMRTTMPPAPTWVSGRAANERFYRLMFGSIERTVSGASSRSARACAPRERRRGEVPAARLDLPRRAAPGHTAV
ncbi:nuclear transport factor 2 family protein [Sorangium sp. So ce296]|uniref:nuclear transport factor 2 family protein n=1 Tax=Sorangium sp. So ce296 TaxID=3133296 RepID=UPI003F5F579A